MLTPSGSYGLGGGGGGPMQWDGGGRYSAGGNGGSGVVVISYVSATQRGSGGTVTNDGTRWYHTFTSSGSYTG